MTDRLMIHVHRYALGGYDGDGILDVVETFDPRAGRWEMVGQSVFLSVLKSTYIHVCS